jgi:hypothetical protein
MHNFFSNLDGFFGRAGAEPATWPLPLTREGLAQAAKEPVLQPMPTNVHKRSADEVKAPVSIMPLLSQLHMPLTALQSMSPLLCQSHVPLVALQSC